MTILEDLAPLIRGFCTYCGQPATERDHVTPWSYSHLTDKAKTFSRNTCVPSCKNCNATLGAKMLVTIPNKAAYMYVELCRQYAKKPPAIWMEWELEDMGEFMKRKIKASMYKAGKFAVRIDHCARIAKARPSYEDAWQAYDMGITLVEYLAKYTEYRY